MSDTHVNDSRVVRKVRGLPTSDGAGVKLRRVIGTQQLPDLDPFLMLDAFGTDNPGDYIGGFPDHPHRGFETVTYMLDGRMRHRDSAGHEGVLSSGGVQWMTAGRGVIHSEMPEQEAGRMEGFQLWLNLPARDKMCAPWYRDIPAAEIPRLTTAEGVKVGIIAGSSHGVAGAMRREATQPLYLDLELPAGARFEQPLRVGDRLSIGDAGGYTMVKKNWFNGVRMPSIALRERDGSIRLIRQFSFDDYKASLS